jgi:hypothetical protein
MATEILRPNAAGDEENIYGAVGGGSGTHYTTVDEETPDESTTRVFDYRADWYRDLYNLDNHSAGSGTINFIKVYARCSAGTTPTQTSLKIAIKSGTGSGAPDTVDESSEITVASSYADYSRQWGTNPATGSAWTWDEIDNLQAGIALRESKLSYYSTHCTQVYVEVDYTVGGGATEKQASDTGTGADAKASESPSAAIDGSETGRGADWLPAREIALPESGSGADALVSLQTPSAKTASDAGSGVEATPLSGAALVDDESGTGIEAFIARLLAAAETGSGAEASEIGDGGLLKNLFASELGEGADGLTAKIEKPTRGGGMRLWT